jgi:UDP-N-acetylmuramoylalanine--D-glutamate ligase
MEWRGKKVLVVGMEKSGIASAALLMRKGAAVSAADQKPFNELKESTRDFLYGGIGFRQQSEGGFENFDAIVLSPGVPFDTREVEPARAAGIPIIGEVELAAPFLKGHSIGITGSNGKTTTTALTGHILAETGFAVQVGGNIGTPVTAMIETSAGNQWNVLELSSFQLETIQTFRPDIAVILNVTQNHLDRHYTMERYAEAKAQILDHQRASDWAVLNAEDSYCQKFGSQGKAGRIWFSSRAGARADVVLENGRIWFKGQPVIDAKDVPIRGVHNLENTMAAIAAAHLAGASLGAISEAIKSFRAVEHRLEFVRRVSGIDFYNDSKATSVDATLKALDAFESGLWVILGGKDKGSDYTPLRVPLTEKARAAMLIGSAASLISAALDGSVELISSGTLEAAVSKAFQLARAGDTILLAPACASFDQFQSYEHRGRVFKDLVNALIPKEHGTTA